MLMMFGKFTLHFIRSCVENLTSTVYTSKWTISLHNYMVGGVGKEVYNGEHDVIQCI